MKKLFLLILCFGIYSAAFAQILSGIDEVYPLQGEFAAIKKGDQWAFITKDGKIAIDFRNDLVLTNKVNASNQTTSYPIFYEGRCLIKKLIANTYYFGFINEKGVEVIKPQFLNATNFSNGYAIVVLASKDSIGFNQVLRKPIMSNYMEEYVIDTSGELVKYLYNPRKNVSANQKKGIPTIESKFIAPNLVATKTKTKKWEIHQL
ncbi:MAG TPA: WG repeat-containing protein [Lutibacter sp.]